MWNLVVRDIFKGLFRIWTFLFTVYYGTKYSSQYHKYFASYPKLLKSRGKEEVFQEIVYQKQDYADICNKRENCTPVSLIKFGFAVKIKFIYKGEVLALWVGWSINWLYPVVHAMESISFPLWESWSKFHYFEDLRLPPPVSTEQTELSSLH